MTRVFESVYFRVLIAVSVILVTLSIALPAWATNDDATKEVVVTQTEHKWFYWPGWAFVALVIFAIGAVLFGWYKSVLGPKYRGTKVIK